MAASCFLHTSSSEDTEATRVELWASDTEHQLNMSRTRLESFVRVSEPRIWWMSDMDLRMVSVRPLGSMAAASEILWNFGWLGNEVEGGGSPRSCEWRRYSHSRRSSWLLLERYLWTRDCFTILC